MSNLIEAGHWMKMQKLKHQRDLLVQINDALLALAWCLTWGWLGVAKMSCILCHRGAQLILAYSWARLAILVAGKGSGNVFNSFCFFFFISVPLSSMSLSLISSTITSISFLPFSGRWHKMTHKGWHVVKPQHNQFLFEKTKVWKLLWKHYLKNNISKK